MANRLCTFIPELGFLPVNDASEIAGVFPGDVSRVGDQIMLRVTKASGKRYETKAILLKSKGMCEDTTYLVDEECKEAWPYRIN